jgi:arsenite methyltransferase
LTFRARIPILVFMKDSDIKKIVKDGYAAIASTSGCCCGSSGRASDRARRMGYSDEELGAVPAGSNMGLGCGNPTALAALEPGDIVLDLGSGGGFDCFLAAGRVGASGRVIGVDMTGEMIERARANAARGGYGNVEFRLGEIENLPAADASVDVVISNCVINLSPDKPRVFREAFRVLRPGGRLMVSDIVLTRKLPESVRALPVVVVSCVGGALLRDDYLGAVGDAGFTGIDVLEETAFPIDHLLADPAARAVLDEAGITAGQKDGSAATIRSLKVRALKPASG